jgi:uncharacterized protein YndB with AHSA1/START domain
MAADHYDLVSVWHLDAPADQVWRVLADAPRWPEWWPFVEAVEAVRAGTPTGEHSIWRYTWKTMLPYRLRFELCVTRMEPPALLEAEVSGDVAGRGICRIQRRGRKTTVRYQWQVRTCRPWMNWLAPLARPLFVWNHRMVMQRGESCLAAWLSRLNPRPPG